MSTYVSQSLYPVDGTFDKMTLYFYAPDAEAAGVGYEKNLLTWNSGNTMHFIKIDGNPTVYKLIVAGVGGGNANSLSIAEWTKGDQVWIIAELDPQIMNEDHITIRSKTNSDFWMKAFGVIDTSDISYRRKKASPYVNYIDLENFNTANDPSDNILEPGNYAYTAGTSAPARYFLTVGHADRVEGTKTNREISQFRAKARDASVSLRTITTEKLDNAYDTWKVTSKAEWTAVSGSGSQDLENIFLAIADLNAATTSGNAFYAPQSKGTDGQLVKWSSSGIPTWIDQSSLSVGSAATATNVTEWWKGVRSVKLCR